MSEWCKEHEIEFDEEEGCRCCYKEYLLISEFVKDLRRIQEEEYPWLFLWDEIEKKWEEKLK